VAVSVAERGRFICSLQLCMYTSLPINRELQRFVLGITTDNNFFDHSAKDHFAKGWRAVAVMPGLCKVLAQQTDLRFILGRQGTMLFRETGKLLPGSLDLLQFFIPSTF